MFWKHNTTSSMQIEVLLGKADVTLKEVMDDMDTDIINECRAQNKMLIDFLIKPENIDQLVTLTTTEPSAEIEERNRFKYPNIACELLTCDVPAINERLASDKALLDKLYTFLECEPPLNPLLASYFSKIMGALIAKKTEQNWLSYQLTCLQVLDFLKAKDDFISLLLKHLGTSAIMDLTLKLKTQVEGVEMRQNILNWLDSQRLMQRLVSLLNSKVDKDRHYYVAQLLCDFIRIARDTQRNSIERADPDPLLNTLESPETISLLLDNIFEDDKNESAIVGGIQVLLALLDVNQNSIPKFSSQNIYNSSSNDDGNDVEQKQKIIFNTTQAIRARLPDFHKLLLDPPKMLPIDTTVGLLDPPLGNTRLQVTKLYAAILSSKNDELLQDVISLGTFSVILDLFFKYQWNNFLHTQVENCLIVALQTYVSDVNNESSNALCKHLLVNCKLIDKILDAWKENDKQQAEEKGIRQGYMGHLTRIVNKLVELCSITYLGQYLKDNLTDVSASLDEFKDTTLNEINKVHDMLLGGAHPNSAIEDNDDYSDPFPQSSALQHQMFSEYQLHQISSSYVDNHLKDDSIFVDDILHKMDRAHMDFQLSEDDLIHETQMFNELCAQKIRSFDDSDDQIFEEKEQTFQTVIERHDDSAEVVSDSDESPSIDDAMDIDAWSSPKSSDPSIANALATSDPWGVGDPGNTDTTAVEGWADFSTAKFETDFNKAFDSQPTANKSEVKENIVENRSENLSSKDDNTNSIDTVAQEVQSAVDSPKSTITSAAGDQPDVPVVAERKETCPANTPSKSTEEGDSCNLETSGSSVEKTGTEHM